MLKRKRKINKAILIASSRRYFGPLPKAYAELLRRGVAPALARDMVEDAILAQCGQGDSADLLGLVVFSATNYSGQWYKVARV
ncbi:hypothetical protein vBAspALolek_10 [Aeromonas phage vB_AspA_Lolek]|nr:hypothetical protein vBAspALolek_10 [Aeromonas phage vB_AspA_Lolek]